MIKAVIFDLDGLLIDSEPLAYKSQNQVLQKYGKSFTLQEYIASYAGRPGKENARHLVDDYNLPISYEQSYEEYRAFSIENTKNVQLKYGAVELIDYLRKNNYEVCLGTSSSKLRAEAILNLHGILNKFDSIITSDNVKHGKPEPDIFLAAVESLGFKADECLVLEDSKAGIEAANRGKVPAIFIPDLRKADDEVKSKTVAVLDSLNDVIAYLKEHNN